MVTNQINLNGRKIAYTFKRSRRKSIGLKINNQGLTVCAPLSQSQLYIESIIQKKADWINRKLDQWKSRESTALIWQQDTIFPLLGKPWQLTKLASGAIKMVPSGSKVDIKKTPLPSKQVEIFVMAWYTQQATTCFGDRIAHYAARLNLPLPLLRLSRAKTQWGSCNAQGVVRLNWRLIQMPLHLIDYVVVHELSHLIEMNHSPAFWQLVRSIYPDYLAVRKELKMFSC